MVFRLALVEFESADRVKQIVDEHKFSEDNRSYIVFDGKKLPLSKYKSRLHSAEKTWRKLAPEERKES